MTKKITLTKEQAEAVELTNKYSNNMKQVLGYILQGQQIPNERFRPLSELPLEDLMKALVIPYSYEVESQYKDGDIIYYYKDHNNFKGFYTVKKQIGDVVEVYETEDASFGTKNIRHATEDECRKFEEEKVWKSIGREVGEFRVGDVTIDQNGSPIRVLHVEMAEIFYRQTKRIGFYPVESFISFEKEDS
jgi:hypothetical protein